MIDTEGSPWRGNTQVSSIQKESTTTTATFTPIKIYEKKNPKRISSFRNKLHMVVSYCIFEQPGKCKMAIQAKNIGHIEREKTHRLAPVTVSYRCE